MKLGILLLSLLVLAACKVGDDATSTAAPEVRRFEPLAVSEQDLNSIKQICDALDIKEGHLPNLIGNSYSMTLTEKNCEEDNIATGAGAIVSVKIQRPSTEYVFHRNDGQAFAFQTVETTSAGVMAPICDSIADLKSPMQLSNKTAIWFTTSSDFCDGSTGSACIHIQKGQFASDQNYDIHTNEWIKFKVADPRMGFWYDRRIVSTSGCEGRSFERRAKLN